MANVNWNWVTKAQVNTLVSSGIVTLNSTPLQNATYVSSPNPVTTLLDPTTFPNVTIVQTGVRETCSVAALYSNRTLVAWRPIVISCHVVKLMNGELVIEPDLDLQSLIANSSRKSPTLNRVHYAPVKRALENDLFFIQKAISHRKEWDIVQKSCISLFLSTI